MTKAYWVGHMTITDAATYQKYIAANAAPFAKFGAKFLVRGGAVDQREGTSEERTVVLEFPSLEAATACYLSPEYQAAKDIRVTASRGNIQIIGGYDGPQPGDTKSI